MVYGILERVDSGFDVVVTYEDGDTERYHFPTEYCARAWADRAHVTLIG